MQQHRVHLENLSKHLDTKELEKKRLEGTIASLQGQITALQKEKAAQTQRIQDLEEEQRDFKEVYDEISAENLGNEERARYYFSSLEGENRNLGLEKAELELQLGYLLAFFFFFLDRSPKSLAICSTLESNLEVKSKAFRNAEAEKLQSSQQVGALKAQIAEEQKKHTGLRDRLKQLESMLAKETESSHSLSTREKQLSERLEDANKELESLSRQREQLQNTIKDAKREAKKTEEERDQYRGLLEALRAETERLRQSLDSIRAASAQVSERGGETHALRRRRPEKVFLVSSPHLLSSSFPTHVFVCEPFRLTGTRHLSQTRAGLHPHRTSSTCGGSSAASEGFALIWRFRRSS